jgi:heat shock protein HslJ
MVYICRWSRLAMLVLLLLVIAACQRSDSGIPTSPLTGTSWDLVRYGTPLSSTAPLVSTQPNFFSFERDGRLFGSAGCNSMFGTYAVAGTRLIITELGQTSIGCGSKDVRDQESYILQNLPTDATWTIVSDTLTLSDATHTFRFIRRHDQ